MKQKKIVKSELKTKEPNQVLNFKYYILLLSYIIIPVYFPSFDALDSNGPKFLAIAILNLISFLVLLTDKGFIHQPKLHFGFFRNFVGLTYAVFLLISLISIFQVINLSEAIINISKLFSVFASTFLLYMIFKNNRTYMIHVAVAFTILLLFDCLTVFYNIFEYISKNLTSIIEIKSIYSNKNIFSAALFIKIPAALWLMIFCEGWKKKLGTTAFFLSIIAVLFLSTRAFYLGLGILLVALGLFFATSYIVKKQKVNLRKLVIYSSLLAIAIVIFTLVQQLFYTTKHGGYNANVAERLSTIRVDEASTNARLTTWKRSIRIIKENPFFGVGTGNWKINVLKYESPENANFIISYKNHNDFIEVTAETGLPGGLTYLAIFILIFVLFIKIVFNPGENEMKVKYLFLPAFGILAYSVDAFFNFPNDRPEIQSLFALYVAMFIAFSGNTFSYQQGEVIKKTKNIPNGLSISRKIAFAFSLGLLSASATILFINAKSLFYQHYVFGDEYNKTYSHTARFLTDGFPIISNLAWDGAPIKSYIARYLLNENRHNEAVSMLINDKSSPYDGRREYYLSLAYEKNGNIDSLIFWGKKFCRLKPLNSNMMLVLSSSLYNSGRQMEAIQHMDTLLSHVKTDADAWLLAADQNKMAGNEQKALQLLDSAIVYLPTNEKIVSSWKSFHSIADTKPYEKLYSQANQAFSSKQFPEALKLFNDFISKKPDFPEAYQNRALCLYYSGDYNKSISDIERVINKEGIDKAFLLNLRGINNISLGKTDEACADFKNAMEKGNADAIGNFKKFCGQAKKK